MVAFKLSQKFHDDELGLRPLCLFFYVLRLSEKSTNEKL